MPKSDLKWFAKAELSKYKGEYIIISHKHVVMHGLKLKEMLAKFRQEHPDEIPQVAKIPKEDVLVLNND